MSAIFAYAGETPCKDIILDGLSRLKGEAFELSGISMKTGEKIEIAKIKGAPQILGDNAKEMSDDGCIGLAESKTAHRCKPTGITAPPASNEAFSVALDGVIENFEALKTWTKNPFPIATDEDLMLAILTRLKDMPPLDIISTLTNSLQGSPSYAFIPINEDAVYAKSGERPFVVGICEDGCCLSSEMAAVLPYAKKYFLIEKGECARITHDRITVYDSKLKKIKKPYFNAYGADFKMGSYALSDRLSALPFAIKDTVKEFVENSALRFDGLKFNKRTISRIQRIIVTGSGASYRAAVLSACLLEMLTDIPSTAVNAAELSLSGTLFNRQTLLIAVSPSGEDKASIACVKRAKRFQSMTLGVTSSEFSMLERECEKIINPRLKNMSDSLYSYVTSAVALSLFTLWLGNKNEIISELYLNVAIKLAELLPGKVSGAIKSNQTVYSAAQKIISADNIYVTGMGADYAAALEASAEIRGEIKLPAYAAPCSELSEESEAILGESLVIVFITNKELINKAAYYLRRFRSLGAEIIIYTTSNIENEINGFDVVIPVTDSLPVFDTIVALSALEKTLYTANEIIEKETEQQAG